MLNEMTIEPKPAGTGFINQTQLTRFIVVFFDKFVERTDSGGDGAVEVHLIIPVISNNSDIRGFLCERLSR